MRWVVLVVLAGCVPTEQPRCDPGPFWDGPTFENPDVGAAGETLLAIWRELDFDGSELIDDYTGAMVDPAFALTPLTFDERFRPQIVLSGPDRAVVFGEVAGGGGFAQIRLASGDVVSTIEGLFAACAFDGEAFLIYDSDGALVPLALDGTLGPPLALPEGYRGECVVADDVIWVISEGGENESVRGVRISNQVVLDATPRTLVASAGIFMSVGARPGELVMLNQTRDDVRTWLTVDQDGNVVVEAPLVLETDVYAAKRLIGETDDYLMIGFDNEVIRIAPDGTQRGPAVLDERFAFNNVQSARTAGATTLVFAASNPGGTPPQVGSIRIADGQQADEEVALETSVGEPYTVDCGCSTGGGQGWLALFAVAGLRRRRITSRVAR